jgi:hypothetical protein
MTAGFNVTSDGSTGIEKCVALPARRRDGLKAMPVDPAKGILMESADRETDSPGKEACFRGPA